MKEYRVKEENGEFSIQIKIIEEKGCLWWKKKEEYWKMTNYWGGPWIRYSIEQPYSKSFKTLQEAKDQITLWQTEIKYHY